MRGRYLEVTFRKGRAIAAHLYLPRRGTERAARVSKASGGPPDRLRPLGQDLRSWSCG